MSQQPLLSASILSADFAHLQQEIDQALAAGIDYIHFDVMDHHFVPNLSFGACVCASLRKAGVSAPIDVHLMVEQPQQYVQPFAEAGASLLAFHPETVSDVATMVQSIREQDMQVGIVLNPDSPLSLVENFINECDLLLLMSVYPGFAGQQFIADTFAKISQARALIDKAGAKTRLGIDGGVKKSNIGEIAAAGADFFVVGSGFFKADDYEQCARQLRAEIHNASSD